VISWKKFTDKLKSDINNEEYKYIIYRWATALDIANKFLIEELFTDQDK